MGHAIPRPDFVWACAGVVIDPELLTPSFRVNNGFDGVVSNGTGDYTLDLGDNPIDDAVLGMKILTRGVACTYRVVAGAPDADRFKRIQFFDTSVPPAPVDTSFDIEINQFANQ